MDQEFPSGPPISRDVRRAVTSGDDVLLFFTENLDRIRYTEPTNRNFTIIQQKDDVVGIQLEGTAKIITDNDNLEEIKHAYDTYYGRAGHGSDVHGYMNNPTWLYIKVIPERIYYFDTRFFEEERQTVPLQELTK